MADEYIRREDAFDAVEARITELMTHPEFRRKHLDIDLSGIIRNISEIEPADVVPVRHGKWLPIVSYNNTYKCSECGRLLVNITDGLSMVAKHYPYCHCGAKMDGERE